MRKEYLFTMLFLIAIAMQGVFANPFSINYSYVNTDSYSEYLNVQYGNYYDNFSLRLRLQSLDGYDNIPVYVSPQIYGITDSGNLTYLYSVPTQTYYAYSTPYEYTYSNLYYINPNYNGYVVKVYANSYVDYYNTYSYAYVYPVNNAPYYYFIDDDPETDDGTTTILPNCSDFFLSGQADIYLDEGDEYTYNLYIENQANENLQVIDVTTSNASRLEIEDIDFPSMVPDLSVRTIRLYLAADSVSDDYDSSFNVNVRAKYNNTNICTKTYTIEYHIEEENDDDDDDDVSCSDLDITNTSFTIDDDSTSTRRIKLENDSDYDFEIDDITISDREGLDVSIEDEPDEIDSDDYEYLEIELDADDFDYTITKYLELEIEGVFVDYDDDEVKDCTRRATITVRIEDDGDNDDDFDDDESCKDIDLYVMNISQAENTNESYSRYDGFYVVNNSDNTFTISNLSINDNTSYADIDNISYTKTLTSGSTGSINFDLETNNINSPQISRGALSVSGRFTGGKSCSYSDIGTKYFDIDIFEPTSTTCSGIEVASKTVSSGNNKVSIYNRTNKSFYVTSVLFQNKQGLLANASDSQVTISASSNSFMTVGITGSGSLEMLVSGKFSDGKSCSFNQTTPGTLSTGTTSNYSSPAPSTNPSTTVNLSSPTPKISLVSYPTLISPVSNNSIINLSVNNGFLVLKEATIKLAGFPSSIITESKTITLSAKETKQISLDIKISDSTEKREYKGYIEVYSNNLLIDKYPLTIDWSSNSSEISIYATSEKSITHDRTYILTLRLKNNTNKLQETTIDFGLPKDYVIDGDREINILPNEEITKFYKIVTPTRLREDKVLNIKINDKETYKELATKNISLESGSSPISAFFTLKNTGFVLLGIVVLVVLIVLFRKK